MKYDVCIIGAGVAGALAAYQLASKGKSVVMLEAGPRFDLADKQRYSRSLRGEEAWDWKIPERDLYEVNASPAIWLNDNRVKAVGGSTLRWNARGERLQPEDFNMKSRFGIAADWPLTYDDLKPWYFKAEQELGVAGKESEEAPPRDHPFPLPNHPLSFAEREFMIPAFNKLGLSVACDSLAINSEDYGGRPQCEVYSTCMSMCPNHAKYTAVAHITKAESTGNLTVKPNSYVRRIESDAKRRIKSVLYKDEQGVSKKQTADVFVLAAGGVENPRLLLLSSGNNGQNGLANSSKQVGRNYMTHPWIRSSGNLPEKIGPHRTGFSTACSWALYNHENMPELGNAMLKCTANEGPTPESIALNSTLSGEALLNKIRQDYGHEVGIDVIGEMMPQQANRINLSDSTLDCYGDPVPKIEMELCDFDKRALRKGTDTAKNLLAEMNAAEIDDGGFDSINNHFMGTTKMGKDAQNSVCDEWGRCHDLDNLYVAGSSLFPTSGCAAPTLTIAALSLRTAEYISKNL